MLTCYIGFGIDLDGFYFLEMLQIYGAYPLFAIILCNNGFDQCKFNRVEFGLSLVGAVWAWMPNRYPKPETRSGSSLGQSRVHFFKSSSGNITKLSS